MSVTRFLSLFFRDMPKYDPSLFNYQELIDTANKLDVNASELEADAKRIVNNNTDIDKVKLLIKENEEIKYSVDNANSTLEEAGNKSKYLKKIF